MKPSEGLDGFTGAHPGRKGCVVGGHHSARGVCRVDQEAVDLRGRGGVEGGKDGCSLVRLKHSDHVGRLVGVHSRDQGCGGRRPDRLEHVGGSLRPHLVKHLTGIVEIEILEKIGGALFLKSFEDVGRILRCVLGELFPLVVMRVEIGLGFVGTTTGKVTERLGDGARTGESQPHDMGSLSPVV